MRAAALLASARISNQSRTDQVDLGEQAQHYSSEEMDDETPELEEAQRRAQAISRLDGIFELLSQKRIDDIRDQNVLRAQANSAILTIRELVEHVLPTDDPEVLRESMECDYTLSETEELIPGVNRLIQCSDYAEQIRLLTLAPHNWGRAKVESFFTCSERQARYGVYLRDSGRILHRPVDLRGNLPFDPQIEKKIFEFYHDCADNEYPRPDARSIINPTLSAYTTVGKSSPADLNQTSTSEEIRKITHHWEIRLSHIYLKETLSSAVA